MNAVGDGRAVLDGRDHPAAERDKHGGHRCRLNADDLDVRAHGLDRDRNAADQSAAADGDDDLFHIGHLIQDLQPDGTLTRDDIGIVEGMGKGIALFPGKALRFPGGVVIDSRDQDDLGAVAPCRLHLQDGCALRHTDDRLDPETGGGQGDALGVVAGAAGDDAAGGLFGGEVADLVVGAADLEGSGLLKVLRLNEQIRPEPLRRDDRRHFRDAPECLSCIPDHLQGH